ncbi:MAG: CBS domain-containing protein [Candidatus Melainabacteria bacterium]|nr:CBS domain-containing protein [Candidatus Melainabacteria bacterium]
MSTDSEEEQQIMQEREVEIEPILDFALSVKEPIEKILYNEPVIVKKETKLKDAIKLFDENDVGCVLVVDNNKKLIGIFTERDVVRKLIGKGETILNETIEKYMTLNPDALYLTDPVAYALNRMAAGGYRHIPLVNDKNEPVGFVSIKSIVEHLADYYSNDILNLPPSPHTKQVKQEGG